MLLRSGKENPRGTPLSRRNQLRILHSIYLPFIEGAGWAITWAAGKDRDEEHVNVGQDMEKGLRNKIKWFKYTQSSNF